MGRLLPWLRRWNTPLTVVLVLGLLTAVGSYAIHSTQLRALAAQATGGTDDELLRQLAIKQQAIMTELASIKLDQPAGLPTSGDAATTNQPATTMNQPASDPISSTTATGGIVHLNSANEAALETLPDIGPSKAQAILDYRTAHGRFSSIDELDNVKGIGAATIDKLRPRLDLD